MNANQNSYFVNYGDFRMQDWLLKADISSGAKLTYSVLACCAGGKDHAWPSQEFLAEKVSASVRSVQRYLKELIAFGLIEKGRQWIKGQVRCIYRFLIHSLFGLKDKSAAGEQHDNLSPCLVIEPEKEMTDTTICHKQHDNLSPCLVIEPEKEMTNTTICQEQHDNLSPSLNKEETIKGKEDIPPTPLMNVSAGQVAAQPSIDSGKGGEFIFGVQEEDSRWLEAKNILSSRLPENNFKTWILPLIFEADQSEVVLRGPNQFFINWILKNFRTDLDSSFETVGILNWRLALQTDEQIAASEARQADQAMKIAAPVLLRPEEDLEALTLEEQFQRLFEIYPVGKAEDESRDIFLKLKRCGKLPALKILIKAVKDHANHDRWWREHMPPLLSNWLLKNKWKDKPYA